MGRPLGVNSMYPLKKNYAVEDQRVLVRKFAEEVSGKAGEEEGRKT